MVFKKLQILTLIFASFSFVISAQTNEISPYSRFGLGDPVDQNFVAIRSMGGLSATYADANILNPSNPASLGYLQSTAFEVGFYVKQKYLTDQTGKKDDFFGGNIHYLSLGMPIFNPINELLDRKQHKVSWGLNFTLMPVTSVGYNITKKDYIENLDTVGRTYSGSGGTYKFMVGNGFKYKQLSFGANIGAIFGKINRTRNISFLTFTNPYGDNFKDDYSISGFQWNVGAQYKIVLKKPNPDNPKNKQGEHLMLGLTANTGTSFKTSYNGIYQRYNSAYGIYDTLVHVKDSVGHGKLPATFDLGVMYTLGNKLSVGVDMIYTGWSKYENDFQPEALKNTIGFGVGAEYVPDASSYNKYFQRVRYRIGFRYEQDPRTFEGERPSNILLSYGMGLPIFTGRQLSFLNLGIEYGATLGNIPIKEKYLRFSVGVTLNDNSWFFKRKYQ